MTAAEARELLAACKRQRDVWRIAGMPPSPEAVARVERDEAAARDALVAALDAEHAARVRAEAEVDGRGRDLAAVAARERATQGLLDIAQDVIAEHAAETWRAATDAPPSEPSLVDALAAVAALRAERDLYRAALADAARGELPRCDECPQAATLYAATTAGEHYRCDAHAGGDSRETLPHAAALRAALAKGGAT